MISWSKANTILTPDLAWVYVPLVVLLCEETATTPTPIETWMPLFAPAGGNRDWSLPLDWVLHILE